MTFTAGGIGQLRLELFRTGEGPGLIAAGMRAKARCIPTVAHIANEERILRKPEAELCFEEAVVHHAGAEVIADEDDALAFSEVYQRELRRSGTAELDQCCNSEYKDKKGSC